jgi:hypothetical protein
MQRCLPFLILALTASSASLWAGPESGHIYARLSAKRVTRADNHTEWETSWGSYQRSYEGVQVIRVSVNNFSKEASGFCLLTYFTAERVDKKDYYIYDKQETGLAVEPMSVRTATVVSRSITGEDNNYEAIDERDTRGLRPNGYIVVLYVDGEVINACASSRPLEMIGRDKTKLRELVLRSARYLNDE